MTINAEEELAKLQAFFDTEKAKLLPAIEDEQRKQAEVKLAAEEKRLKSLKDDAAEHARYVIEDVDVKLDAAIATVAKLLKERLAVFDEIGARYSAVVHVGHHARNPRINSGAIAEILNVAMRERRAPTEGGYTLADMRALGAVYSRPDPKKGKARA